MPYTRVANTECLSYRHTARSISNTNQFLINVHFPGDVPNQWRGWY